MAGQYNFTLEQGSTFSRTMVWKDKDGTPKDLSTYTARMMIRRAGVVLVALTDQGRHISWCTWSIHYYHPC